MSFIASWLIPRVSFWVMWTAWLCAVQFVFLERLRSLPDVTMLAAILAPPVVLCLIGSRLARNPLDSPASLFWRGAAASCFLTIFAHLYLMSRVEGFPWILGLGVVCVYLGLRGGGGGAKRAVLQQGNLFEGVQAIARRAGARVQRVTVFQSPKHIPSAFAFPMSAILISDELLRILSRRETDAVIAHEVGHLRQSQRTFRIGGPLLAGAAVVAHTIWPELGNAAPFVPFAVLLVWYKSRRVREYDADAKAVATMGEGESLITALTRVSNGAGMPLHWGALAGLFMPHPPMSARFRAIARRSGLSEARVAELVALAGTQAAEAGYGSPIDEPVAGAMDSKALEAMKIQVQTSLVLLSRVLPIAIGLAAASTANQWRWAGAMCWTMGGMMLYYVAYEVLVGMARRGVRKQIPGASGGQFCGLAMSVEPRTYGGMYHYDLGVVQPQGGALVFRGVRCEFSLAPSMVRRVWLTNGPKHWTPRKIVCVAYQAGDGERVISMQAMDSWFWPGTLFAATSLLERVTAWSREAADEGSVVPPPLVEGDASYGITLWTAIQSMKVYCLISMALGTLAWQLSAMPANADILILTGPFMAPAVTAALMLFGLAPHLAEGVKPQVIAPVPQEGYSNSTNR